ncbi:MAG: hypothetical protein Q9221_007753 [Calogaya cf. arnoldii]
MHFSTKTIIAISTLCTLANSAPAHARDAPARDAPARDGPVHGAPFSNAVRKLDAEGKITWSKTASGARTCKIPFDDINQIVNKDINRPANKYKDQSTEKDKDRPANKDKDQPTNKDKDRPTNKDEDRPTKKDGDRPTNKDGDRSTNKDEIPPTKKDEDRPTNKDEVPPTNKDEDRPATKLTTRDTPDSGVGDWRTLGSIANYAACFACQDSGEYGLSTVINSQAEKACKELVDLVPGAPIASQAWNLWEKAKKAANGEGEQTRAIFRFFYSSDDAPKLNEVICKEAIDALTSTACQGTGGNIDSTLGGEVRIGDYDHFIQIGFDPNSV